MSAIDSARTMSAIYDELRDEFESLRRDLAELVPAPVATALLVDAIRSWELRCERFVAARSPQALGPFRVQSGPLQRRMGDGWMPKPGWRDELEAGLDRWMTALEESQDGGPEPPAREPKPGPQAKAGPEL